MKTVGAFEAKTHLAQLLEDAQRGEEVLITRHGKPMARLVPSAPIPALSRAQALARLRSFRQGKRLDGLSILQLRDQGRGR
jgi:prevent-host-death family protein